MHAIGLVISIRRVSRLSRKWVGEVYDTESRQVVHTTGPERSSDAARRRAAAWAESNLGLARSGP